MRHQISRLVRSNQKATLEKRMARGGSRFASRREQTNRAATAAQCLRRATDAAAAAEQRREADQPNVSEGSRLRGKS
jgi:hypothetical protein